MKTKLLYKGLFFLFFSFAVFSVQAQEKEINVKSVLEGKNFIFKAQSASPTALPMRQLTGDNYNLRLSGATLISFLPYFGRAFTSPSPGAPGGYSFTSTEFDYTTKSRRKGGWDVVIK